MRFMFHDFHTFIGRKTRQWRTSLYNKIQKCGNSMRRQYVATFNQTL